MDLKTVDHLLTTTRTVRKRLDLDRPVEPQVIERCIEIAMQERQAPRWSHGDARAGQQTRIGASSAYLEENLHRVPIFIIPCVEAQMEQVPHLLEMRDHTSLYNASVYGSILPAAWSLMLALRARGLGSAWTTLHLMYEEEAAEVLGIPEHVIQVALLPVAYYTGSDFRPAKRLPAQDLTHWNAWGGKK
jgi:nitroreductase